MEASRRERTLANLDRINPLDKTINRCNMIVAPVSLGSIGAITGGLTSLFLGQPYGYGASLGAIYGSTIPCAYGLGYGTARACRHYQDIRKEALARGVLSHHNPLEHAVSGASKD
jgi:hypothetical protein